MPPFQPSPTVSVVIPWCDRAELARALAHNRDHLGDAEVVVVNCGGDPAAFEGVARLATGRARFVTIRSDRFNKSRAMNLGASLSAGEVLLFLDADVLIEKGFLTHVMSSVGDRTFMTVAEVAEADHPLVTTCAEVELRYSLEIRTPSGTTRVETNRVRPLAGVRAGPGLIGIRRCHFLEAGGMNSIFDGWGWEDLDLIVRLHAGLSLGRVQAGRVVHLTHSDVADSWNVGSRQDSERTNFFLALANYAAGNFVGSFQSDTASTAWNEIC
jgi:glycosyltransferase involved in cell wall biosynthesis